MLTLSAPLAPSPTDELDFDLDTVTATTGTIVGATGDFLVLNGETLAFSFNYGTLDGNLDPLITETLFSLDGFVFTGTSVNVLEETLLGGTQVLTLSNGTGLISKAGFDDTAFLWEFSAVESEGTLFFTATLEGQTEGGGGAGAGPHMPEPSSFLLFTLGFAVVRGVQRRR